MMYTCTCVCRQYTDDPETGKKARRQREVILTDPRSLGHIAVDSTEDMLVAFCKQGTYTCTYVYKKEASKVK